MFTTLKNFFTSIPLSRSSLSLIGLFVVLAAIPLTVFIAQQQQEIRQMAAENQCQGTLAYTCGVGGYPNNKLTTTWNLVPVLGENTCNVFIRKDGQDFKLNSGNECSGNWSGTQLPGTDTFIANSGVYQLFVSNGNQSGNCYNVMKSLQGLNCTGTLPAPTSVDSQKIPYAPGQQSTLIPPPISPTTAPITPTPTLTSTSGVGGTTAPFAQGSVTGPTTGKAGEPLTFTANVSGAVIKGQLWVGPFGLTSSGFPKWEQLGSDETCSHSSVCTFSRTWTPANDGTFYVVVAAFNAVGKNCSGGGVSPSGGPIAPYDCGSADNIAINVSGSPLQVTPPTASPTPPVSGPTASPTPAAPPPSLTQTPAAGATSLAFSFKLQGITADSAPKHSSRQVKMEIFDTTTRAIVTKDVSANFQNGIFSGTVDLGTGFTTAPYFVKLKINSNTLRKRAQEVTTITAGAINTLPEISFYSGDINDNNELDAVGDYTYLIGCLDIKREAGGYSCANRDLADLNDDGAVDGLDLNILINNFSHRTGD